MRLQKVISGGQTGVDRAGLDAAIACGIPVGGWCPHGRRAEDGQIPGRFPLVQTPSPDYPVRTKWNVRDSDATLVVTLGTLDGGTELTAKLAAGMHKPCLVVRADRPADLEAAVDFIDNAPGSTLNVAGPRESRAPGVYRAAHAFLVQVFGRLEGGHAEALAIPKPPPGTGGAEAGEEE